MDCQLGFHFMIFVASIFYCVAFSSAFDPPDNYLIDCGSNTNTTVGGRVFVADILALKYLSTTTNILANTSSNLSLDFPPYQTARVFLGNSKYTFPITQPGRHWVRLYFFPFAHGTYNMSSANFSISTQSYHLLSNFSPKGTCMKEFLVYVSSSTLVITFTPSNNSFAFINGLEIVSVPNSLITGDASTATDPVNKLQGLLMPALETVARVNMGGPTVSSNNDTLWQTWVPDQGFLTLPSSAEFVSNTRAVWYPPGGATQDTAPVTVYGTATAMHNTMNDPYVNFNVTWEFTVDPGFQYLIRLHFCDLVSKSHGDLHFNVYIGSLKVLPNFDLSSKNFNVMAFAYYEDFVTPFAFHDKLHISIGSSTHSRYHSAFLNGVEIMKMNNSMGSLCEVANVESSTNSGSMKNIDVVVGLSIGVLVAVVVTVVFLLLLDKRKVERHSNVTTTSAGPNLGYCIPFAVVQEATRNFDESLVIGAGDFGRVYKGALSDGTLLAVKRGNPKSQQGLAEFQNEIEMLSQLHHQHLVSLIGYCDEHNEKILIYEYMENGTLNNHLYGSGLPSLNWKERLKICIGAAKGLQYLHENAVIHRDVKSSNILLDKNLSAKVADFGLSKLVADINQTHVTTVVKGSFGYLDPEYALLRQLREKLDVYSFGVVLFEVLCARPVIDPSLPREMVSLSKWAMEWQEKGQIEHIIDPNLVGEIRPLSLRQFAETAAKCLAEIGVQRPSMGDIIWNLEYALQLQDAVLENDPGEKDANVVGEVLVSKI